VHSGGINAVAMATPGISVVGSFRVCPIMPAAPPKKAISTSQIVGDVRANSSDETSDSGVITK
jgi:hypothetical protein